MEPRRLFASLSAELIDGDVIITGTNRLDLVKVDLRKNGKVLIVHSTGHNLFDRLTDTGAGDQQLIRVRLERVKRLTFFAKAGTDKGRVDRGTAGAQETVENTISNLHRIERFGKIRIRDFDFLDEQ